MTCACIELTTYRLKAAQWDKQIQTSDKVSFSSLIIGYNIGSSSCGSINGANEDFKSCCS